MENGDNIANYRVLESPSPAELISIISLGVWWYLEGGVMSLPVMSHVKIWDLGWFRFGSDFNEKCL